MKKLMLFFCLFLIPINIGAASWTSQKPSEEERIINEKTIYTYQKLKPVRYAFIYDIYGKDEKINLKEIELYVKGEKKSYSITSYATGTNFDNQMMDEDFRSFNIMYLPKYSYVIIDFEELVELEDVELKVYVYNDDNETDGFTIAFNDTKPNIKNPDFYFQESVSYNIKLDVQDYKCFSFTPRLETIQKSLLQDNQIEEEQQLSFPYILIDKMVLYQIADKKEEQPKENEKEDNSKEEENVSAVKLITKEDILKTTAAKTKTKQVENQNLEIASTDDIQEDQSINKVKHNNKKTIIKNMQVEETNQNKKTDFGLIPLIGIFILILVLVKIFISKKRND